MSSCKADINNQKPYVSPAQKDVYIWQPPGNRVPYLPEQKKFYVVGAIENLIAQGFQPCMSIVTSAGECKRFSLAGRIATATLDGKYVNHIE